MNRKKIYLDGFDWVANLLNEHSRMTPGKGNHFIVVLETAQVFPTDLISALVQSKLEKRLPLLNGSIHRHLLHLAPYWKLGPGKAPAVTEEELLFTSDYSAALDRFGNTPLPPHQALALHVIRHKTGSALLFKFSHLLFDCCWRRSAPEEANCWNRRPDFPLPDWTSGKNSSPRANRFNGAGSRSAMPDLFPDGARRRGCMSNCPSGRACYGDLSKVLKDKRWLFGRFNRLEFRPSRAAFFSFSLRLRSGGRRRRKVTSSGKGNNGRRGTERALRRMRNRMERINGIGAEYVLPVKFPPSEASIFFIPLTSAGRNVTI